MDNNSERLIPDLLRGRRLPVGLTYDLRKNPSLVSPGLTSRRRDRAGVRILRSDTFNRNNSSSTLGAPSDGGSAWDSGSFTFGISSNQAYQSVAAVEGTAVLECGAADVQVQAKLTNPGTFSGLAFRYQDASNRLILDVWGDRLRFVSFVAGSGAVVDGGTGVTGGYLYLPISANDVYRVRAVGSDVRAYQVFTDGTVAERLRATSSLFTTATKHGIRISNNSALRTDDFLVTTTGPLPALKRLLTDGNSQNVVPSASDSYQAQFLASNMTWSVQNRGVAGNTIAQRTAALSTTLSLIESGNTKNIVVFTEVINSIYFNRTAAEAWSDLQAYAAAVRANNPSTKICFITPQRDRADFPGTSTLPGADGAAKRAEFVSRVSAFMTLFYANPSLVCDGYYDVFANANFVPSNATYINADGVHWTATAAGVVAAGIAPIVNGF